MSQSEQASLFPAKQPSAQGPWPLPSGWEWVPLRVACLINPRRPRLERADDVPTSFLPMSGVDEVDGAIVSLEERPFKEVARGFTYFEEGDVLFAKITPCMQNGKCIVARGLHGCIGFGSTEFHVLRPGSRLTADWVHRFLRRLAFRLEAKEHFRGAVGQQRVPEDFLASSLIPVPPNIDIQRRIVARIETLLTEVKEARVLATAIRHDTGQLLAASVHEVFATLSSVANIVPLKKIATAFNGRASGEGSSAGRVFKTKHIYPHFLRLDRPSFMKAEQVQQLPKDRYIKPGDVLMANIAEGTLGRVTYVCECEESWTVDTQVMILRSLDDRNLLLGKWLYYYLWSECGQQEILARRSGIAFADKRGQTHIYPKNVLEIPVPVPPIENQIQAVAHLNNIQAETDEMRRLQAQDAELLDQLEQSILERAFRGEL